MAGEKGKPAGGSGGNRSTNVRDEIVRVATRLFAEKGYSQTTMTEIAKAAKLRQPSVYYWFRNKEELLNATASVKRFSPALHRVLKASDAGTAPQLYRLLLEDTRRICRFGPLDYHQVEAVAFRDPGEFSQFWSEYRLLFETALGLIRRGQQESIFRPLDAAAATASALCLNEGLQKLYRYREARSPSDPFPDGLGIFEDVDAVAHQSASNTLLSLLSDPNNLAMVRTRAGEISL